MSSSNYFIFLLTLSIKIPDLMTDFKQYLQCFPLENQICEIDSMLQDFYQSNRKGENVNKKFRIINELKVLKKKAILNYEKYSH